MKIIMGKIIYLLGMTLGAFLMLYIKNWWYGLSLLLFAGFLFIESDIKPNNK